MYNINGFYFIYCQRPEKFVSGVSFGDLCEYNRSNAFQMSTYIFDLVHTR